jgi:hypothetical protein
MTTLDSGSSDPSRPSLSPVFRAWLDAALSAEPATPSASPRALSAARATRALISPAGEIGVWIRAAD